ncbi:MAG: hypothetical protein ACRCV6_09565 [Formosimonas sp.]
MTRLWLALGTCLALSACQTAPATPTLTLNKNSVDSWHVGQNAQGQSYLLVVLKQTPPQPVALRLGAQRFDNANPLNGGFLVLHPLPHDLTTAKIHQLLD